MEDDPQAGGLPRPLGEFWAALGDEREFYNAPTVPWDDPIYCIRTRPGYIFDDQFWEVFVRFPFVVCHVAYYGPERLEESRTGAGYDLGIFELRWTPNRWPFRSDDRPSS